jgi:hypothetical protein
VTWCMDGNPYGNHPNVQKMQQQLEIGYDLVFTSKNGLAKVFRLKGLLR